MMSWAYHQREGIDLSVTWSLSTISHFLPSEIFYCFVYDALHNVPAFSATIAMLIVVLAVMMIDGKGTNSVWRTKVLQATGIAGVLVCVELAYSYSFWHDICYNRTNVGAAITRELAKEQGSLSRIARESA